jgi:hypothetical protein
MIEEDTMRSFAAHLQDVDSHDRLPFHAACPICRQTRLTGTLPADALMSQRTQAMLAAGVLAVSTTAPTAAALGAEQDQQQEGSAQVIQGAAPDPAGRPDFDPGGAGTDLPAAAPSMPALRSPAAPPGDDDNAPVEQSLGADADDPVVDSGDGSDEASSGTVAPPPPARTPTGSSEAPPASPPTPTSAAGAPSTTSADVAVSPAASTSRPRVARASGDRDRHPRGDERGATSRAPTTIARRTTPPTSNLVPAAAAPARSAVEAVPGVGARATGRVAKPGDRTHTVLRGESLWAIASDLLGRDASPARVAREVHRLWQLNRDRIGTGDPELLLVGTTLVLR